MTRVDCRWPLNVYQPSLSDPSWLEMAVKCIPTLLNVYQQWRWKRYINNEDENGISTVKMKTVLLGFCQPETKPKSLIKIQVYLLYYLDSYTFIFVLHLVDLNLQVYKGILSVPWEKEMVSFATMSHKLCMWICKPW